MTAKELLLCLSDMDMLSGRENESALKAVVTKELNLDTDRVTYDNLGNLIVRLTEGETGGKHILLEAHADEIGLIVTDIDEDGTLKIASVGGVAPGNLLGSRFRVYGKNGVYTAVTVTAPPHLIGADADAIPELRDLHLDVGMTKDEAAGKIAPGDVILRKQTAAPMGETRVTGKALDDRAGVVAVLEAGKEILQTGTRHTVTLVFTSQEEVGGRGATVTGYTLQPDEAICVDVSFATQPGVTEDGLGKLGEGPMLGYSPILSRPMWETLCTLAKEGSLPYQAEIMGGRTGTDADELTVSGKGIACALVSIPQRNMHTDVEVVDVRDVENAAHLMAAYCTDGRSLSKEG